MIAEGFVISRKAVGGATPGKRPAMRGNALDGTKERLWLLTWERMGFLVDRN